LKARKKLCILLGEHKNQIIIAIFIQENKIITN